MDEQMVPPLTPAEVLSRLRVMADTFTSDVTLAEAHGFPDAAIWAQRQVDTLHAAIAWIEAACDDEC